MKNFRIFCFLTAVCFLSCKNDGKNENNDLPENDPREIAYNSYGDEITSKNSLSSSEMEERFENLKAGDTVEVNFRTTVNEVCKNKGCWMKVDLPEEEDVMVKFRDYGFFVPKNIEQKEVIMKGKAYISEVSVEEQQHYAEDNGDSPEEIAAITQPKRTLSFLADGVLIKK